MLQVRQEEMDFDAFIRQHRPLLLRVARRLCRHGGTEPEDLVQETLARALQDFGKLSFDGDGARQAWLCTTLTRCFFDGCRRRRTEVMGQPDLRLVHQPVPPPDAPRELWESVTEEQLLAAVARLREPYREAYTLHAAGRRYREIARRFGVPEGTVGGWLTEARRELKAMLSQGAPPPGASFPQDEKDKRRP